MVVQEEYQEALDVLLLAEEAFDMCNPKHLDMIDNVGLLMIDIVWCVILLLSVACCFRWVTLRIPYKSKA